MRWIGTKSAITEVDLVNSNKLLGQFSSVHFSRLVVSDSATPWIAALQASLSITNPWSSLRLTSIESVMPSSHLILRCPLFLLSSIPFIALYCIGPCFYPVTPTTGYCFCFGSIPSFLLKLFLHWSPVAYWAPTDLGSSSFSILWFCLFILFMGFSRQEYWSGLPFPSPVDRILSDLSTMTSPTWVAPRHGLVS